MKTPHLSRRARRRALALALFAPPSLALAPITAHASAATCGGAYSVRPGDSLWSIGAACGVPVDTLRRLNLNRLGSYLQPGQVLQLGAPYGSLLRSYVAPSTTSYTLQSYVVRLGDTLTGIAQRLGLAPTALAAANGLGAGNLLRAGQVLHWSATRPYTTPAAAAPATATTASGPSASPYAVYRVRPGDTLWGLALARRLSPHTLASANGLSSTAHLRAGALLRIPTSTPLPQTPAAPAAPASGSTSAGTTTVVSSGAYRVRPGDTLWGIAQSLGLAPDALAQTNGLDALKPIQPGQLLRYAVVLYRGPSRAEIGAVLDQQAAQVGIEDALLKAIAWRESSWRMVDASDGGIGVMQLMPYTVSWLRDFYVPGAWDPHNLTANVHAGAVLLLLYDRLYGGNVTKIATAYHGGIGAVVQPPTAEMRRYTRAVIIFRQAFLDGIFPM